MQVALNWIVSKKGVVAIPKAGDAEHMLENAGASGWKLTQKEGEILIRCLETSAHISPEGDQY